MEKYLPIIFIALIPIVFFIYIFYRAHKYKDKTKNEVEGQHKKVGEKVDAGVRKR